MTQSEKDWPVEIVVWSIAIAGGLFFGGVIWVAVHFIIKFW